MSTVTDKWREVQPVLDYPGMTELTRNGLSVQVRGVGPAIREFLLEYFKGILV